MPKRTACVRPVKYPLSSQGLADTRERSMESLEAIDTLSKLFQVRPLAVLSRPCAQVSISKGAHASYKVTWIQVTNRPRPSLQEQASPMQVATPTVAGWQPLVACKQLALCPTT
jgi:hypothetical protein